MLAQLAQHRRQSQLFKTWNVKTNGPKCGAHRAALEIGIDAESAVAVQTVREVELLRLHEHLLLCVRHGGEDEILAFRQRERPLRQRLEDTVSAGDRRRSCFEMQV